jgi:hypothetical protein
MIIDLIDSMEKDKSLGSSDKSGVADRGDADDRCETIVIVSHANYPHREFLKVYGCILSVRCSDCNYANTIE